MGGRLGVVLAVLSQAGSPPSAQTGWFWGPLQPLTSPQPWSQWWAARETAQSKPCLPGNPPTAPKMRKRWTATESQTSVGNCSLVEKRKKKIRFWQQDSFFYIPPHLMGSLCIKPKSPVFVQRGGWKTRGHFWGASVFLDDATQHDRLIATRFNSLQMRSRRQLKFIPN